MATPIDATMMALDVAKKLSLNGGEYWTARDLQLVLGYSRWENFEGVIRKAVAACSGSGEDTQDHFLETKKVIIAGKGAEVGIVDFYLTRYACYLIAMNGDPAKTEIATAQSYFAVQTRRQELAQADRLLEKRQELRGRLTTAVKALNTVAKEAGVQNYALFHDAGYRGLYSMGLRDVKNRKGIGQKEDLFDRVGRAELAANEFRVTQAEQKIVREKIRGQVAAMAAHKEAGMEVRKTMQKISGMNPESLPAEPSLKQLVSERRKRKSLANSDDSGPKQLG